MDQHALRSAGLLVLLAGVSILAYDPQTEAQLTKLAVSLVAAILLVSLWLARQGSHRAEGRISPDLRINPSDPILWLLSLTFWVGLSTSWGPGNLAHTWPHWLLASSLALVAHRVALTGGLSPLALVASTSGSMTAVWALVQFLRGNRGMWLHAGHGNPNWLGLFLALSLTLSLGAIPTARSGRARALLTTLLALQVGGVLVSQSRVAWVALAAAAVLLLAQKTFEKRLGPERSLGAALLLTASLGAIVGYLAHGVLRDALHGRPWIWEVSWRVAKTSGPRGSGGGSFALTFAQQQGLDLQAHDVKVASQLFENAQYAHNDFLQTWIEAGWVGLFLLIGLLFCLLRDQWRHHRRAEFGATIVLAIGMLGDGPLLHPPVFWLLGLMIAQREHGQAQHELGRRASPKFTLAAAGLVLAALSHQTNLTVRSWMASRQLFAARQVVPQQSVSFLTAATDIAPQRGDAWLGLGLAQLELGRAETAIPSLQRARLLLANTGTDVALGNALVHSGSLDEGIQAYRNALAVHPGSFRALTNLAESLRRKGHLAEAQHQVDLARRLYPSHTRLAEIEERLRRTTLDYETGRYEDFAAPLLEDHPIE